MRTGPRKTMTLPVPAKTHTTVCPILEVAVWSKPYGRYRGPLPRGKAVQAKTCDILAAFVLSRRTVRYSGVEKHAAFGPKMVADDIVPGSLALREARLKRRAGLACPPGEGCVLLYATATSKAAPAKCRPRRRWSVRTSVGTPRNDYSAAAIGPHRPTAGSRPWTSPAKERAVTLTA